MGLGKMQLIFAILTLHQINNRQSTKGFAKCGLDIAQHQLLFCYSAAVIRVTEFFSAKKFYLEL